MYLSERRYREEGTGNLSVRDDDIKYTGFWGMVFLLIAGLFERGTGLFLGSNDATGVFVGGIMTIMMAFAGLAGAVLLLDARRMLLRLPPYR